MAPVAEELAAVMPAFGCGVPSTVAGVDVLGVGVGVTVPDVVEGVLVVEPVVVGVTVPAGVRVDGVVTAGPGAEDEFDSHWTVMLTPLTTALWNERRLYWSRSSSGGWPASRRRACRAGT